MKEIRAFDMFCGGGGSSLGARDAGAKVVGGVDLWDTAVEAFKLNFPNAKVFHRKVQDLAAKTITEEIGRIDLLLSSPECTHHTCARGSKPRSEKSKETALQVLRFARVLKPRWVVLENVVHMRPWDRYEELKETLEDIGYHVREQVLNAADFGVPQSRRRLFLIADRLALPPEVVVPEKTLLTVQDILDPDGTWNMQPLRAPGRAKGTLERAERAIESLGEKKPFLLVYYGTDGSGGWQPLNIPLRTVTTVDRFALVKPGPNGHMMRMLQPQEIRRAMGFPTDYKFPQVNRRDRIKLLGNAVCSPVMRAIVETIQNSDADTEKNSSAHVLEQKARPRSGLRVAA